MPLDTLVILNEFYDTGGETWFENNENMQFNDEDGYKWKFIMNVTIDNGTQMLIWWKALTHNSKGNKQHTKRTFNETRLGSASAPPIQSSADIAASSESVSGYKSSWKSSDFLGTVNVMTWHKPLLLSR